MLIGNFKTSFAFIISIAYFLQKILELFSSDKPNPPDNFVCSKINFNCSIFGIYQDLYFKQHLILNNGDKFGRFYTFDQCLPRLNPVSAVQYSFACW